MNELREKCINDSLTIAGCRKLPQEISKVTGERRRVAVLASFTVKGLADCLKAKAYGYEILTDVYDGEYGQWRQDIMGEDLYSFDPEIIFLFIDNFGMDSEAYFRYDDVDFDLAGYAENTLGELSSYVSMLKTKTKAKIVISNAVSPCIPLFGPLENKIERSFAETIYKFNQKLCDAFKDDGQVFVFDLDNWLGRVGKEQSWQGRFFFAADMKVSPDSIPVLSNELMSYIVPLFGKKKKCIVLDLDNTLWGGVVGEDGVGGIKLAPTGEGQPFYYFQKALLQMKRRGFLLAICSKNNEEDVREVFAKHTSMVLSQKDFAASRINWEDKAVNIKSIAKELNIGLDTLIFVDDDPTHTQSVKELLKEVDVITLPKDPTGYIAALLSHAGLSSLEYTEEDSRRTEMYVTDKERKKSESEAVDMESFLKGLNIELKICPVDEISIKRSAQLTQKTNQFNLTTKRYTEEDLRSFLNDGHHIWTLEVRDRFGNYGIVGLCIAEDASDHWHIDTFLMSCRVLGRRIEYEFINHIINELHAKDLRSIRAKYIPTAKNMQVKGFYESIDFKRVASDGLEDVWELTVPANIKVPGFTIITAINS